MTLKPSFLARMISSASMNEPSLRNVMWSKIARAAQLEGEVDVAHPHAEQPADQEVVAERVHRAQRALAGAVESVGADDVGVVVAHQPDRPRNLGHVERQIGVAVQHDVAGGSLRTRSSSSRRACG